MKVLEKLRFSEFTEMSDREMKHTFGGSGVAIGTGTCGFTGEFSWDVPQSTGVSGFEFAVYVRVTETITACNVARGYVESMRDLATPGTFWWCCESCNTSSYCGG